MRVIKILKINQIPIYYLSEILFIQSKLADFSVTLIRYMCEHASLKITTKQTPWAQTNRFMALVMLVTNNVSLVEMEM